MSVLAVLRHDQRLSDMAGGNAVSAGTVRRWRDELVALFAARAPRLDRALRKIAARGGQAVLIDGTLIPTLRRSGRADRANYSGKHHRHGLHFLALTDERGRLIWIGRPTGPHPRPHRSPTRPHATTSRSTCAPRAWAPWPTSGSLGLDDSPHDPVVVTGYKAARTRKLTVGQKRANRILAAARAVVEHGFAHLRNWRILSRLRTDPARATALLRALLVLTNLEVAR